MFGYLQIGYHTSLSHVSNSLYRLYQGLANWNVSRLKVPLVDQASPHPSSNIEGGDLLGSVCGCTRTSKVINDSYWQIPICILLII